MRRRREAERADEWLTGGRVQAKKIVNKERVTGSSGEAKVKGTRVGVQHIMYSKGHDKAVYANDVTFATLVHNENMTIVADQGMFLLQSEETGKLYFLPTGLQLNYQAIGKSCSAIIRDMSKEVILEPGPNDIYEEDLHKKENTSVMPVDEWNDILTLMDELKLESITSSLTSLVSMVGGIALSAVSCWLTTTQFFLKILCYGTVGLGIVVAVLGALGFYKKFRCANAKVIVDKNKNYINLDTGMSSLNGGMIIPIK